MSTPAIICDTGALLDFLVEGSPDHLVFRAAIDKARARFVPGLVLAELDYFLRDHRAAMRVFIADIERGAFIYAPPTPLQLSRAMAVDAQYSDLGLGLVDASIVALAEELDLLRLATRDVRDFAAVRLGDGRAFDLVVRPGTTPPRRHKPRRRR